ncbi:uncharacterized protein A1O9_04368 [Exophiala aquamarina CBS 119918]|uniref:DUF3431 domain-containing protein n=1 Tax=Exophiala aquamarina CBS 119918 TaxID=1182545 RepID=A0A072PHB2_9EURO|nr:uncharacterized protein A1O9_04368 [Exophiala aquamarina CBS 119918]KEF59524.1 hypothetical protein A1O9_04368 [Exophiala aquamarina CBS 119918]
MVHGKRTVVFLALAALFSLLFYFKSATTSLTVRSLRTSVPQVVGLGDYFDHEQQYGLDQGSIHQPPTQPMYPNASLPSPSITPVGKPSREYTRNLIMARMTKENVSWIDENDLGPGLSKIIYVADDPKAPHHPPQNKGHEVMTYLTYILEFYENLPDVSIFMHSHRYAWHNDDLLNFDAAEMIKRLSSERVLRNGYMNMRCHWMPGCPEWIHPAEVEPDKEKLEQSMIADAWAELFPGKEIPRVLAQPCCSQFALSRDRIQSMPKETYEHYRAWLLRSPIRDTMSGRIFEYIWQVIFADTAIFCPNQRTCYCDGFGVCFEDEASFDKWFELRYHKRQAEHQLAEWEDQAARIEAYRVHAENPGLEDDAAHDHWSEDFEAATDIETPEPGKDEELRTTIRELDADLEYRRLLAIQRGTDPSIRAASDGREWNEGDGF